MGDRIDNLTIDGKKLIIELKVLELRAELERRGLSKYGNKKELLQRLSIFEENRQKSLSGQPSREAPNQWLENEADLNNDFLREYFRSQKALFQEHAQRRTEIGVGEAPNVALRKDQSNDEFALSTSHRESFSLPNIAPTSPSKKKKKKKKASSDDEQVTYTPPLYESSLATSRPSRSSAQTSRALNVVSFDDEDSESTEVDPYVFDIKEKKKGHKKHHRLPTLKLHSPTVDSVSQKSLVILSSYSGEEKVPSLKIKLPEPVPKISTSIISPTKDSINRNPKISKDECELPKTSSTFKKSSKVCLSPQNAEVSSSVEEIVTDTLVKSMPDSCADSTSNEGNSSSDNEKHVSSVEEKVAPQKIRGTDSSTPQKFNLKISPKKLCHLGNQKWYSENNMQKESPLLTPSTRNIIKSVVLRKETESNIGLILKLPTSHIQSDGVKPTVRKRGRPRLNPIPVVVPSPQVHNESLKPSLSAVAPCKVVSKNEQILHNESVKPCTRAVSPCKVIPKNEKILQSESFKPFASDVSPCKVVPKNEQILQSGFFKPCASAVSSCKVVPKNEQILQSESFKPCTGAVVPKNEHILQSGSFKLCAGAVVPKNEQIYKKLDDQKLSNSQQSIENQIKEDLINLRLKELDIKESKLKQLAVSYQSNIPTNSPSVNKKIDESIRRSSRLYKPLPAENVKKKLEFSTPLTKPSKPISTLKSSSNRLFSDKTQTENLRTPAPCEQPDYFESLKQQIEMPLYVDKFPSDKSEVSSSTSELSETIKLIPKVADVPCNYQPFTRITPILDAHMVVEGHTSHASNIIPDDRNIGSSLMVPSLPKLKPVQPNLESSCTSPVVKKSGYLIENLIVKANEKESGGETFTTVANTCENSSPKVASTAENKLLLPLKEKNSLEPDKAVTTESINNWGKLEDSLPFESNSQKCETEIVIHASEALFTKHSIAGSEDRMGIDETGSGLLTTVNSDLEKNKESKNYPHLNECHKKKFTESSSVLQNDNSVGQPIDKVDGKAELTNLCNDSFSSVHGALAEAKSSIDVGCHDKISVSDTNKKHQVSNLELTVQQKIIHDSNTSASVIKKLCTTFSHTAAAFIDLKIHKQTPDKNDKRIKQDEDSNLPSSALKLIENLDSSVKKNTPEIFKNHNKSALSANINVNTVCTDLASNCKPSISNVIAEIKKIKKVEETGDLLPTSDIAAPESESETQKPTTGDSEMISFKDILMEAALAADIDSDDLTDSLCATSVETVLTVAKRSNLCSYKDTHDGSCLNQQSSLDSPENVLKGNLLVKFPAVITEGGGCRPHSKKHDFIEKLSANVYNAKKDSSKGLMEIIFDLDKRAKQTSEIEEHRQNFDVDDNKGQTQSTTIQHSAEIGQEVNIELSSEKDELRLKEEINTESHVGMESFLLCKDLSDRMTEELNNENKSKSQALINSPVALDSPNETTSVSEEEVNFFREVMESVPELGKKKPCFEPLLNLQVSQNVSTENTFSKANEQLFDNKPGSTAPLDILVPDSHLCESSNMKITSNPSLDICSYEKDKSECTIVGDILQEKASYSVEKPITANESELPSSGEGVSISGSEVTELNKQKVESNSKMKSNLSRLENFTTEKLSSQTKHKTCSSDEVEDCAEPVAFKTEVKIAATFVENLNSLTEKETTPLIEVGKSDEATLPTDEGEIKSHIESAVDLAAEAAMKMDHESVTSSESLSVFNKMLEYPANIDASFLIEKSEKEIDGIGASADTNIRVAVHLKEQSEIFLPADPLASTKKGIEIQISKLHSSDNEGMTTYSGKKHKECSNEKLNLDYTLRETLLKASTEVLTLPETSNVVSHSEEPKKKETFEQLHESKDMFSHKEIVPDLEVNEAVSAEIKGKAENLSLHLDSISNLLVKHDIELTSKLPLKVSASHSVLYEVNSSIKEIIKVPIKLKSQSGAFNPSNHANVELKQFVPKLSSLAKDKMDSEESESTCRASSVDNSMENLLYLPSVEKSNSQTNKPMDYNTSSTFDTFPKVIIGRSDQPATSSFGGDGNVKSIHELLKDSRPKKAEVSILETKTSPQAIKSYNLELEKESSNEKIGTCSTTFTTLVQGKQKETKIYSNVFGNSSSLLSENSKTCCLSQENVTQASQLDVSLVPDDDTKMASICQNQNLSCNLQTDTKINDLTQISDQLQVPCSDKIQMGSAPEVVDFNLNVEPNLNGNNLKSKLLGPMSLQSSNEVHSVISTIPSKDNFDRSSGTNIQIENSEKMCGDPSNELLECSSAVVDQIHVPRFQADHLTEFTPLKSEITQIAQLKELSTSQKIGSSKQNVEPCTEQNDEHKDDRNSQTSNNQKLVKNQIGILKQNSGTKLDEQISETEEIEQSVSKTEEVEQSISNPEWSEQSISKTEEIEQSISNSEGSEQSVSKTEEVEQSISNPEGSEQSISKTEEIEQSISNPEGSELSICKTEEVEQSISNPEGSEQSVSKTEEIEQSISNPEGSEQSISKTEESEQSSTKEICLSKKPVKDLSTHKIEIPFIKSFLDNSTKRLREKIEVTAVASFKLNQYVDTVKGEEKIKIDYKKKTFDQKPVEEIITSETNQCSSKHDSKSSEMERSEKNYTEHRNIKQTECFTVLPRDASLPKELRSQSELGEVNPEDCKEIPFVFDISSIPLPPVMCQDSEGHNTSVVPIVKRNSLCDSNEGNFVADKMARKNKNAEALATQREANNGDTNEGEHSPKRMNTRQRSRSTEKDLVVLTEVERRDGKLRRSSRGNDKAVSEKVEDKHDSDKNGTNNNQCLESISELNENSVKEDRHLGSEAPDLTISTLTASIENPADIPMPDIASVPLPDPKSASGVPIVSECPVVNSDSQMLVAQPDGQSVVSNVDHQENKVEPDVIKAAEVAATTDSASDKKEQNPSTSISSIRSSTEEAVSHSKRRGHSRSRSASSSSDRSSSKRKSYRKSRHSSSRRRSPSSSGRYHRKSSRYSRHSSHKADGRSHSRSVENSSSKKRDERKDEKEKEEKRNKDDKKNKEDKNNKEERLEKELEDSKRKAANELVEALDKSEIQDTTMKMSAEKNSDESVDKNAKNKKLRDRTSFSGDKDSRRENEIELSSCKDSKKHSSRGNSSKKKDKAQDSVSKDIVTNYSENKTSEDPKSSNESSDPKIVERTLSEEENQTEQVGTNDDPVAEAEDVKQEPDAIFKSARKVSLLRPKSIGEEEQEKPKKRKWGSSATTKPTLEISSNSLKTLIPDVKPLSSSEVTLKYSSESSEEEEEPEAEVEINLKDADHNDLMGELMSVVDEKYFEKSDEVKKEENEEDNSKVEEDVKSDISPNKRKRSESADVRKKERRDKRESRRDRIVKEISPRRHKKRLPEKTEHPLIARKFSAVEAGPYSYKPSIAPAHNPVSRVIIITNLTRPFTVKAITDLLLRTGRLTANGFWIDRIKSTCLAMFENEDQAEETRAALHGVKWPADNNKNLFVDFAAENDLMEKLSDMDNSLPTYSAEEPRRDRRKFEGSIREWDLAKVGERSPGEREREKERQRREREEERERDKRRREQSPKEERKLKKPPPVKSVDDLFKKTKARPFIYWLPLTPEQIIEKEALRRKKMAESERMLAEIKEQERLRQKKREKEREQREKEREQREKERIAKRSRSRSRRRSRSRSQRKSPRRSPRRSRKSGSRDSRKSHRRSRSRSRS